MPESLTPITQAGLDRVETNLRRELLTEVRAIGERLTEIDRRLGDLNNSHEKAVVEKKRTDEAALQVQERTVSRVEFQTWKDEVNRIIATEAGKSIANAKTWAAVTGVAVILVNIIIRYLTDR